MLSTKLTRNTISASVFRSFKRLVSFPFFVIMLVFWKQLNDTVTSPLLLSTRKSLRHSQFEEISWQVVFFVWCALPGNVSIIMITALLCESFKKRGVTVKRLQRDVLLFCTLNNCISGPSGM